MPDFSLNVATHLVRMAADNPGRAAIHFPRRGVKPEGESEHGAITFDELQCRQRRPRSRAGFDRNRSRHADGAHGPALARLLRADLRALQGRRGAGA